MFLYVKIWMTVLLMLQVQYSLYNVYVSVRVYACSFVCWVHLNMWAYMHVSVYIWVHRLITGIFFSLFLVFWGSNSYRNLKISNLTNTSQLAPGNCCITHSDRIADGFSGSPPFMLLFGIWALVFRFAPLDLATEPSLQSPGTSL